MLAFTDNWYPCEIEFDGMSFPSAENAFQATRFADRDMRRKFMYLTPQRAFYNGQTFKTTTPGWNGMKYGILYEILRIKFSDPELKRKLMATGDIELKSTNLHHDNDTGICVCSRCKGRGLNATGLLLEKLRGELQARDHLDYGIEDNGCGYESAAMR